MKNIYNWILIIVVVVVACFSCQRKASNPINVMSYNIRYDNPEDSLNNWKYRKDIAIQMIKDYQVDILGTQEVLHNQLNDLINGLPNYVAIGVGREDGKQQGEYSAIFYNKNRFEELESGYFWLSESPDSVGSKGWDGACERIATWARLEDKESKAKLFFMNTHLDHVGKIARQEGVTLLLSKANSMANGLPIVITGDFNAQPDSEVIKHVLAKDNQIQMFDSRKIANKIGDNTEGDWTFHGFGEVPEGEREYIDYIFVDGNIEVYEFSILPSKINDIYLSDHRSIISKIKLK